MTTPTGSCGWNTGRVQSGAARCGKPRKARTNHPTTDNGEVCGTHLRAASRDAETVEVTRIVGDPAEIVALLRDYAAAHDQNEED